MSFIKSALEIAMEKTEGIKGDKTALAAAAGREEGKKLASAFFADPSMDIAKKFKEYPGDRLPWIKEGFFGVVSANLTMPRDEADLARLEPIGAALEAVIRDKSQVRYLKQQITQFFKKCIEDRTHLADALMKQLQPMLRQKEAQLSKQVGRPVKIDPKADPDFAKAYNRNMGNLESKYGEVLAQVKAELAAMFEKSK
jgi:hypothetical protein